VRDAQRKLRAWKLKTLPEIFDLLDRERIVYAVMRNWEALPDHIEVGPHSDLDLLVHPDHVDAFDELLDAKPTTDLPYRVQRRVDVMGPEGPSFVNVDVRSPGDAYYPDDLADRMLARRVKARGFWVLHPEDHLLGLAYHMLHHKGIVSGDYVFKMTKLAERIGLSGPSEGGEWSYALGLLRRAGIEAVIPDDETVRPFLTFVEPPDRVATSRFLAVHEGIPIVSRVYISGTGTKRRVLKQTTASFARHEYDVLKSLETPYFPTVSDYSEEGAHSSFVEAFIDGIALEKAESVIRRWSFETAREFVRGCARMLGCLTDSDVTHRDIRANNILVSGDQPVLLDFGWATSREHPFPLPDGNDLGGDERVPDGEPCDAYSMGFVLRKYITPYFPEFLSVVENLLRCRAGDEQDWVRIEQAISGLIESHPSDSPERFVWLCELGRYGEAQTLLPEVTLDASTLEDVCFWRFHLARCGEGADGWGTASSVSMATEPYAYPETAFVDPALAARLIREAFAADESEPCRDLLALAAHYLDSSSGSPSSTPWRSSCPVLDAIAEHYAAFAPVLDHSLLREAFTRAERFDEWLIHHATWLADAGTDSARSALVQFVETTKIRLTPEAAESLARVCDELGLKPQAVELSRSVLYDNPYSTMCARILAEHLEKRGEYAEALDIRRRIATINGSNREARARMREIQHHIRSRAQRSVPDASSLSDQPQQLLNQVREWVSTGAYDVALVGARKLIALSPEFAQAGGELLGQLEALSRSDSTSSESLRIVIDPLNDETYAVSPQHKLAQLIQLAETPLGGHPIIQEELRQTSEEAEAVDEQPNPFERHRKAS